MHKVAIPIRTERHYYVQSAYGLSETKGDVGIEVEVEGNKFPKQSGLLPSTWKYVEDHSLRGYDNAEYILRKPVPFNKVEKVVTDLFTTLTEFGSILDDSNRTSVHVHLNCQTFYADRMATFAALFFSVEELLSAWAGEYRVGNLFCLRAKDAPAIVTKIRDIIRSGFRQHVSDGMHYAGFNAHSLAKFGSVEIRFLRGATEPQLIIDWVKMLERLYVLSGELKDPREVMNMFSYGGPINYLHEVFGDTFPILFKGIDISEDELRESLYQGIRLAQTIAYCYDWGTIDKTPIDNPFNRNVNKIETAIAAMAETSYTPSWSTSSFQLSPIYPTGQSSISNNLSNYLASLPTIGEETESEDEPEYTSEYDEDLDLILEDGDF